MSTTEQLSPAAVNDAAPLQPAGLWTRANFVDRVYLVYFLGLTAILLLLANRVTGLHWFLVVHLVSIAVIVLLVLNRHRGRPWFFLHAWYPLAMPIVTFEEIARLNFLFVGAWQDHYILRLEEWLFGVHPTVWFQQHASWWLTEVVEIGYFSYFLLLMIVAGKLYIRADKRPFFGVMSASVLSYMLCYVVFLIFPTEGPAHTLREFHTVELPGGPFHWLVNLIQKNAGVHGNAFPSAHVAGGLAAVLFGWFHAPRLGAWLTPLMILLCIGAVYDRYHYFADVVAGLPLGVLAAYFVLWAQSRPGLERRLNITPELHS